MQRQSLVWLVLVLALISLSCSSTQERTTSKAIPKQVSPDPFLGRWDLTVKGEGQEYPSWLELSKEDSALKGRFVGKTGSARPIISILIKEGQLEFSLPRQGENRTDDLVFKGSLSADKLEG